LTADQLGLAIGQRAEEISDKRVNDGRFAGARITTNDDEPAAIVNDVVQGAAQLSPLLSAPDYAIGARCRGRPGRSNHKHYRATWL